MAGFFGNAVARNVVQGNVFCTVSTWTPLRVGAANQVNRQWMRIQVRGTSSLALKYSNINADGTFTAAAGSAHDSPILPARSVHMEALSDTVTLYGRAVNKAGSTGGGVRVTVTEYS